MIEIERSPRAIYEDHLRKHQLAYQYSPDVDRAVFYPRVSCPHGGLAPLEWRVSAGQGAVYSISLVHPASGAPYTVALIDLDEGFRMMSTVRDATGDIDEIGRRVQVTFEEPETDDGTPRPVFLWENQA